MSGLLKGTITIFVSTLLMVATTTLVNFITGTPIPMLWLSLGAALLVWLPACAIMGGNFVTLNANSKRSGTFVYSSNLRGGGFDANIINPGHKKG